MLFNSEIPAVKYYITLILRFWWISGMKKHQVTWQSSTFVDLSPSSQILVVTIAPFGGFSKIKHHLIIGITELSEPQILSSFLPLMWNKYNWSLNNSGLNYVGPLVQRYFSVVNTIERQGQWLVEATAAAELQIQRAGYKLHGLTPELLKGQLYCHSYIFKNYLIFSY